MAARSGAELTGLAVVTLAGGERLGRLADILFDAQTGRVAGFLVNIGGLHLHPRFLPVASVQSLGTDALTVTGADALSDRAPAPDDAAALSAKGLQGRPVLSEAGSVLGKVFDTVLDTDALSVPALLLATGILDNALHGKPHLPLALIRAVGPDSLVVANAYDPRATESHAAG